MSYVARTPHLGVYPIDERSDLWTEMEDRKIARGMNARGYDAAQWGMSEEYRKTILGELKSRISEMRRLIVQLRRGEISPDVLPGFELPPEVLQFAFHQWNYRERPEYQDFYQLVRLHEKEREVNLPRAVEYYVENYARSAAVPEAPGDAGEDQLTRALSPEQAGDSSPTPRADADLPVEAAVMPPPPGGYKYRVDRAAVLGPDDAFVAFLRLRDEEPERLPEMLPYLLEQVQDDPELLRRMLEESGASVERGLPDYSSGPEHPAAPPGEEGLVEKAKKGGDTLIWVGAIAGGISAIAGLVALVARRKR